MAKKPKKKQRSKPIYQASDDVGYGIGPTDMMVNPTASELKDIEEYQDAKADFVENLDYKLPEKKTDAFDYDAADAFLKNIALNELLQERARLYKEEMEQKIDKSLYKKRKQSALQKLMEDREEFLDFAKDFKKEDIIEEANEIEPHEQEEYAKSFLSGDKNVDLKANQVEKMYASGDLSDEEFEILMEQLDAEYDEEED